ncbi:toprim domain-containing protein [Campylobacter fetus subsp. venerealis]|uniref:toprim domain-containing protein n=1 Tax=Campylobacter fetus TaxID=196 RepID=UPI00054D46B5|nr:toprim domain-containing protein [Campylobacter fetus]OCS23606.1 hypothetical protein CFVI9825_08055 [Campylobacter fetus subsp. venerealis cfvi9825]
MNHTREETAQILMGLGYEIDRSWKFRIRADDATPSASINGKTGKIKDFGSGWYGSAIDLMVDFHGYSKANAFKKAEEILGQDIDLNFSNFTHTKQSDIKEQPFITQNYIDKFQQERKENFKRYWELLSQTMPTATKEQKEKIAKQFEIGYTKKGDRLIMPIKDEFGNCVTLWKYNKHPTPFIGENGEMIQLPKLMFSGNRKRSPLNIGSLERYAAASKESNEPIFIMEGEKDCLNALAKGLNAITLGSANALVEERHIPLFKDTKITICYDYDEAGINGAKALKEQLKDTCKSVEILDWEKIFTQFKWSKDEIKKGFDFTDYLVKTEQEHKKEIHKDIER